MRLAASEGERAGVRGCSVSSILRSWQYVDDGSGADYESRVPAGRFRVPPRLHERSRASGKLARGLHASQNNRPPGTRKMKREAARRVVVETGDRLRLDSGGRSCRQQHGCQHSDHNQDQQQFGEGEAGSRLIGVVARRGMVHQRVLSRDGTIKVNGMTAAPRSWRRWFGRRW